jgi:hypothetical protein
MLVAVTGNILVSIRSFVYWVLIGIVCASKDRFLCMEVDLDVKCDIPIGRSSNLISIVRERGFEGMVCDALRTPYRDNTFVSHLMNDKDLSLPLKWLFLGLCYFNSRDTPLFDTRKTINSDKSRTICSCLKVYLGSDKTCQ